MSAGWGSPVPQPVGPEPSVDQVVVPSKTLAQGGRSILVWVNFMLACVLLYPAIQFASVPRITETERLLVYALIVLCGLPTAIYLSRKRSQLPVFPFICLVYAAGYAVPVLFAEPVMFSHATRSGITIISEKLTTQALWYSLFGVFGMQVGFWLFQFSALHLLVPRVSLYLRQRRAIQVMSWVGFLGLLITYAEETGHVEFPVSVGYAFGLLKNQTLIAIGILYWYFLKNQLPKSGRLWFYSLTGGSMLLGLTGGNLRTTFIPLMIIGVVFWMVKQQLPARFLVICAVAFSILQPIKMKYREMVWFHSFAAHSVSGRAQLWIDLVKESLNPVHRKIHIKKSRWNRESQWRRLDFIHMFSYVIAQTPSRVPYQMGFTYRYLLYAWIPRFFWPQKPFSEEANRFFGIAYLFRTADTSDSTSIGAPHMVEAFVNFGAFGVPFVMMVIGMIYGAIDRLFNHTNAGEGGTTVYAVILPSLLAIETAAAPTFGAIAQTIVVYLLILRMVRARPQVRVDLALAPPGGPS